MSRIAKIVVVLGAGLLAAACSLAPAQRAPITTWDFGPAPAPSSARLAGTLLVLPVEAPAWLDSPAMVYRLAYADQAEPRIYANSRWVASPSVLLTERLRATLAAAGAAVATPGDGIRNGRTLRVEVEQFDQIFDAPAASQGVLRLRATLVVDGRLGAQKVFEARGPAGGADAKGGALALGAAADRAIGELIGWLAQSAPRT
jgi:cholesterol transport system auxiliary component